MRLRIRVAAAGGVLVLTAALVNSLTPRVASQEPPLDVVITGGRVMDPESGLDAARNVGIRGGKIVQISEQPLKGKETIDAPGLVVAPGFIDLHQHGQNAENDAAKAADGVTTSLEMEVGTADIDGWYAAREGKERVNYGVSVGHIPVRMAVTHDPGTFLPSGGAAHRAATPVEIEEITQKLDYGLKRGALGVGAGPAYTIAATNWELVEVFRVAAHAGATVHIHIRSLPTEREGNFVGFEEAMAAAAATGASLHVVQIQSTNGPNVAHELQMIEEARARGMDVSAECYPYDHGMTGIESAIFDGKENEPVSYYAALLWPATGEHLTRETFLKYRKTGGMVILPSNTEENVHLAVVSPWTMIASDGRLQDGKGHPRTAGTYSLVLGRYGREQSALALMTALRKMTLMPAQRMEMRAPAFRDKGRIRVGADADVTIFDAARIRDRAIYQKPSEPSEGISFVLVNGVEVIRNGKLVDGAALGRGVRAPITH